jgi:hypothetical protein
MNHAEQIIDQAWATIDPTLLRSNKRASSQLPGSSANKAENLRHLAMRVGQPPMPRFPGFRGSLAYRIKTGLIRLLYWYVEPRWAAQSAVNQSTAEYGISISTELEALRVEVAQTRALIRTLRNEIETMNDEIAMLRQNGLQ